MKLLFAVLVCVLPQSLFSANLKNNACPKLKFYPLAALSDQCYVNPNIMASVEDIVKRHDYNFEKFNITTDDGYILSLFQISRKTNVTKNYSVFLQHGLGTNSGAWVSNENRSLAFYLADRGYQVWLGNPRGTTYSRGHKNLSINDKKYWDYNLDTLAEQDLRLQLKFAAENSKQKIHYIGHSMGTTLIAMFLSEFPEEGNKWIQSASLLAPVIYFDPKTKILGKIQLLRLRFLSFLGVDGHYYHETSYHKTLMKMCQTFPHLCLANLKKMCGPTKNMLSEDLLLYFSLWPTGTSNYQMQQYAQISRSKKFQKFDYGRLENLKKYGSENPPVYNLSQIQVPVGFYYGENDALYSKEALEREFNEFGSSKKYKYSIPMDQNSARYNHIDFVLGKNIDKDLYQTLLKTINKSEV